MRVYGFAGQQFEATNVKDLDVVRLWMESIAKRVEKDLPSVRGYPVKAMPGEGPVIFVALEGATGDVSAGRELREKLAPILREEIDKEGTDLDYTMSPSNKDKDLIVWCTIIFPPP